MVLEDYYEPDWLTIALVFANVIVGLLVIAVLVVALVNWVRQRRAEQEVQPNS